MPSLVKNTSRTRLRDVMPFISVRKQLDRIVKIAALATTFSQVREYKLNKSAGSTSLRSS